LLLLVTVLLLALTACTRRSAAADQANEIKLEYSFEPAVARLGAVVMDLRLTGDSGAALEGAQLKLKGDMNHAGMAPVLTDFRELEPGHYRTEFEWTMAGAWILTIEGQLPDGRTLQRQIDLDVAP